MVAETEAVDGLGFQVAGLNCDDGLFRREDGTGSLPHPRLLASQDLEAMGKECPFILLEPEDDRRKKKEEEGCSEVEEAFVAAVEGRCKGVEFIGKKVLGAVDAGGAYDEVGRGGGDFEFHLTATGGGVGECGHQVDDVLDGDVLVAKNHLVGFMETDGVRKLRIES